MAKKNKDIKFDFNKEIIVKTSLKKKLIVDLSSSIFAMVILYICLTDFNEEIVSIFSGVAKDYAAMDIVLIFLPILLIVKVMLTLGQYVISQGKEKK